MSLVSVVLVKVLLKKIKNKFFFFIFVYVDFNLRVWVFR